MKSLNMVASVLIFFVFLAVAYGVFLTNGSEEEVAAQLEEITPANERNTIDANILNRPEVAEVEKFRTFGTQPVQANPASLDRPNPFDAL